MAERLTLLLFALLLALIFVFLFGPSAWLAGTYSEGSLLRGVAYAVLASAVTVLLLGLLLVKTEKWKKFEAQATAVFAFVFSPILGLIGAAFGLVFGPLGGVVVLAGTGFLLAALAVAKIEAESRNK
jgi:energy-converting hydrogenase Eha subunit A